MLVFAPPSELKVLGEVDYEAAFCEFRPDYQRRQRVQIML